MPAPSSSYINDNLIPSVPGGIDALVLNETQSENLNKILIRESNYYFYTSSVTLADALRGIGADYYSWSIVKLYYSVFYSIRGSICIDNMCFFYHNKKPYILEASPGSFASRVPIPKKERTTHGVAIALFKYIYNNTPLIGQQIDNEEVVDWIKKHREEINYKNLKFSEPEIPAPLGIVSNHTCRDLLEAYINDTKYDYEYDRDHAIIAYPVRLWYSLRKKMDYSGGYLLNDDEIKYLQKIFRDKVGPISCISEVIKK